MNKVQLVKHVIPIVKHVKLGQINALVVIIYSLYIWINVYPHVHNHYIKWLIHVLLVNHHVRVVIYHQLNVRNVYLIIY